MYIFQPKNGPQPTFPPQHQPFLLFILGLPGAITAHLPSPHPYKGRSTHPSSWGGGQEKGNRKYKLRRASGPESHILMRPPRFHAFYFILPCPKSTSRFVSVQLLSTWAQLIFISPPKHSGQRQGASCCRLALLQPRLAGTARSSFAATQRSNGRSIAVAARPCPKLPCFRFQSFTCTSPGRAYTEKVK